MNIEELQGKKIAVLLSGGVDSSVVVYEFNRLGLHPDCFYIKIGPEEAEEWARLDVLPDFEVTAIWTVETDNSVSSALIASFISCGVSSSST